MHLFSHFATTRKKNGKEKKMGKNKKNEKIPMTRERKIQSPTSLCIRQIGHGSGARSIGRRPGQLMAFTMNTCISAAKKKPFCRTRG